MSPNKIIPSLKWGHSNILSLDGFNFVLNPEKHSTRNESFLRAIDIDGSAYVVIRALTAVLCPSPRAEQNMSKSLVKPAALMKRHLPPEVDVHL